MSARRPGQRAVYAYLVASSPLAAALLSRLVPVEQSDHLWSLVTLVVGVLAAAIGTDTIRPSGSPTLAARAPAKAP